MIQLKDILTEWNKDSVINKSKLDEESLNTAVLHAKYLEILSGVRVAKSKQEKKLETYQQRYKDWVDGKLTKDQMDEYHLAYDPFGGYSKPLKGERTTWIQAQPEIQSIRLRLDELKQCEEALLEIINNLNWRHQSIRNAIDWMRFTSGG